METTLEKPTSLAWAQSRMAVHSAPDWDTRASLPGMAVPL